MVPFPVTLSDPKPRFQGHGVMFRPMNALDVLCSQLTHGLFAIAKFLFHIKRHGNIPTGTPLTGASNAGGVSRNRDSESISGFTAY